MLTLTLGNVADARFYRQNKTVTVLSLIKKLLCVRCLGQARVMNPYYPALIQNSQSRNPTCLTLLGSKFHWV
jgi:hypothetical protein